MISNGPCSSRLSFHSGSRTTVAASTSSSDASTYTCRNPSRRSPRSPRRNADRCPRITCGPNVRSGRARLRSWQTRSGRFSTIATGRQWCSLARATSGLRSSARTLVASTTVSRPAASRLPAMNRNTSNASPVADWSFSSSQTNPRQKSLLSTSVGRKCFRANVDFPDPLGPMRTTRESWGIFTCMSLSLGLVSRAVTQVGQHAGWTVPGRADPKGRSGRRDIRRRGDRGPDPASPPAWISWSPGRRST